MLKWISSGSIRWIHGVADILLGFGPKDAGSIPAGSIFFNNPRKMVKNGLFCLNDFDIRAISQYGSVHIKLFPIKPCIIRGYCNPYGEDPEGLIEDNPLIRV